MANITFILHRCHCSFKYKYHSRGLTFTFSISNSSLVEKLNIEALIKPNAERIVPQLKVDNCVSFHPYVSTGIKMCTVDICHYNDVIMGAMASKITSLTIVYPTALSDADQRKHQSSATLAFVWGIHRWPVNSPHKWPVTRKMFPFDDFIMADVYNGLKKTKKKTW